ncbi:MAG: iron transporter FeoB [Firmicutes bacterium]|nr:iron transporter FeoB [Bacillota bacterium]
MGMTRKASGIYAFLEELRTSSQDYQAIVALAGNPNTGKSTVFNGLTGLNQHTGNWPGKTVVLAKGFYRHQGKQLALVDLPGTYSLLAQSVEEQVARDFICFGEPDAVVVVTDATCLERNLNLALQIMEITSQVIMCLNLLDEAKRKQIQIDREKLQTLLGIPVIPTIARNQDGLDDLKTAINRMVFGGESAHPRTVRYDHDLEAALTELVAELEASFQTRVNPRWLALRLLDSDYPLVKKIISYLNHNRRHTLKSTPQGVKL